MREDSLAVHSLAYAAFRVLFDLSRDVDIDRAIREVGWSSFVSVPNFLKHADKDPDDVLRAHTPKDTWLTLGLGVVLYNKIAGRKTCEMWAFDTHVKVMHPKAFRIAEDADADFERLYQSTLSSIQESQESHSLLVKALLAYCRSKPIVANTGLLRTDP
jgi:hypothetical protein